MAYRAKRNPNRCPTHPGALLREDVIPATGKSKAEIAQLLGISRQHLYDILRERKPVSPAVAVRLEHDPEKWMPVFRKDHAPTKKLDHDPIQFDRIMV